MRMWLTQSSKAVVHVNKVTAREGDIFRTRPRQPAHAWSGILLQPLTSTGLDGVF